MTAIAHGSISTIHDVIDEVGATSIIVFAGGGSYEACGASAALESAVASREVTLVRDIPENPDLEAVNAAIKKYRDANPGLSIAVGGGSVLDLAKVVNVVAPFSHDAGAFLLGEEKFAASPVPLVAIPTTSGSGSEATRYAVVTLDGRKVPIGDPALLPSHVILDPELTYSLPPHIAASTGLDALAQAMESIWSLRSDEASTEVATRALNLAWANLEASVHNADSASRDAMFEAGHLSGVAIDQAPTSAPHAISFHLTTVYGVPHGHAVALTLGAVLEYNSLFDATDLVDPRGAAHVKQAISHIVDILGGRDPRESRVLLYEMIEAVGLEPTLNGVGLRSSKAREALAEDVSQIRLVNNPRGFDTRSLRAMIEEIE